MKIKKFIDFTNESSKFREISTAFQYNLRTFFNF